MIPIYLTFVIVIKDYHRKIVELNWLQVLLLIYN